VFPASLAGCPRWVPVVQLHPSWVGGAAGCLPVFPRWAGASQVVVQVFTCRWNNIGAWVFHLTRCFCQADLQVHRAVPQVLAWSVESPLGWSRWVLVPSPCGCLALPLVGHAVPSPALVLQVPCLPWVPLSLGGLEQVLPDIWVVPRCSASWVGPSWTLWVDGAGLGPRLGGLGCTDFPFSRWVGGCLGSMPQQCMGAVQVMGV